MEDIELVTYLLVFALSLICSMVAVDRKSSIFSWLGTVSWFVLSACHLALTQTSDFIIVSWLFVMMGLIFMVYGFVLVFSNFQTRRREREWELR
jgi:NADH:ubiquinone oxidoreductase subunit 6 (subunit J)